MNKLKAVARSVSFSSKSSTTSNHNRCEKEKLEPVVGFQLTLYDAANDNTAVPQLDVHLVGARHLPSNFGLKTVEGYIVKVKLFPGSAKFDSSIQSSSWPKFNETFRFPMAPLHKSSLKSKNRDNCDINGNFSLPEKVFKGTFVVFTVIALLELPAGSNTGIKGTYKSLKRQGSLIIRDRAPKMLLANLNISAPKDSTDKNKNVSKLTASETQRNIGSVTFFLDPKKFVENPRAKTFSTTEIWLPIRDITITPNAKLSVTSSPKGQVEMILELCDSMDELTELDRVEEASNYDKSLNPFECDEQPTTSRTRFSFGDMKFPNMKRLIKSKREKQTNGLCLKVTTSKMRCSIKVKEEFENDAAQIYLKTTVFEHNILSGSWKSESFSPSLSSRWDQLDSTITIPLPSEDSIEHISVKTTVATKTKLGKKIVLGTIYIRPELDTSLDHWTTMLTSRGIPAPMWYSFE